MELRILITHPLRGHDGPADCNLVLDMTVRQKGKGKIYKNKQTRYKLTT